MGVLRARREHHSHIHTYIHTYNRHMHHSYPGGIIQRGGRGVGGGGRCADRVGDGASALHTHTHTHTSTHDGATGVHPSRGRRALRTREMGGEGEYARAPRQAV